MTDSIGTCTTGSPYPKGRRVKCPCCKRGLIVRAGQVWRQRSFSEASLRIVSPEQDGAIVEQVGREGVERRWGVSYVDLLRGYERA